MTDPATALQTPADRLRQEARELRGKAIALEEIAAQIDRESPASDRLLEMHAAEALTKRSSSQLYRDAKKFGVGWKLPSGSWRFSERLLRAFMRGELGERDGENGEAGGIPVSTNQAHASHELELER